MSTLQVGFLKGQLERKDAEIARLRAALERSMVALDDWLNLFASEHCDASRVSEAKLRVYNHGTIGYIAEVQQQNREALKENNTVVLP